MPDANYVAALVILALSSISFIGIGIMTSVLPLISPEKGTQLGFIAQGTLLVVSGVYYPVSVLPDWMRLLARSSRPRRTPSRGSARRFSKGKASPSWRPDHSSRGHRCRLDSARALGVQAW